MAVYFIGGSPCSGKSTVAQALSARYDLTYFKVDDHLDRYLKMGAADGKPFCSGSFQHGFGYDLGQIIAFTDNGTADPTGYSSNSTFHMCSPVNKKDNGL